jgi:ubiquitin conjugation factor E4 B
MLADAPDDFVDPIDAVLMTDPVILPSSGLRMERASILRHLLNDPRDPITRQPLSAADLKPDDELRDRVSVWKAGRLSQNA